MTSGESEAFADPHFSTEQRRILQIWNKMQRIQTDFAFAQELSFYYTSQRWLEADSVLDVGTGNGYYLKKLSALFPQKIYTGIDMSRELIEIANREVAGSNISFIEDSLSEHSGTYDFVVMRLLLQHLEDIPGVLERISKLTRPSGTALIIDANDSLRFFHPTLPQFTEFFAAYAELERRSGRDRGVADLIENALSNSPDWVRGNGLSILIPSTIGSNLDLFSQTYALLVDLVSEVGELTYDFESVKEAWRCWSALPGAYTQVGLNLISIERS